MAHCEVPQHENSHKIGIGCESASYWITDSATTVPESRPLWAKIVSLSVWGNGNSWPNWQDWSKAS
jgi:hypothetical protein